MRQDFSAAVPPEMDSGTDAAIAVKFASSKPAPAPNTPEGFAALAVFAADWSNKDVAQIAEAKPALPIADPAPLTAAALDATIHHDRSEGPGWFGCAAAAIWAGIALGAPLAYWGPEALGAQHPALLAALAAVVAFPAVLILFGSAAARDAARARAEARKISQIAGDNFAPRSAPLAEVEKFGAAVRTEINALETVVERAMSRLNALEAATAKSREEFGRAVAVAEKGAETMTARFDREVAAFEQLNLDLRHQTDNMGQSVSRQIRLMREASRLVNQEVTNADQILGQRLGDFTAVAAVLGERTAQIEGAVDDATMSAEKLSASMGQSLDVLHGVAQVNEHARRQLHEAANVAAEAAMTARETTLAAVDEAGRAAADAALAVREAAGSAVDDANRAAAAIRAQAQSMTEQAQIALNTLEAAAAAAREASAQAQEAADRQAANIQRRLTTMGEAARVASRPVAQAQANAPALRATAGAGRVSAAPTQNWTRPAAANDSHDGLRSAARRRAASDIVHAVGLRPSDTLQDIDLDRILARARFGDAARRRAVRELAPAAIERLAVHLARDEEARFQAQALRRDAAPNLDPAGNEPSEELAAWLLLDASLG